jgi:Holliday junction resolvase RusA-like endonuclease
MQERLDIPTEPKSSYTLRVYCEPVQWKAPTAQILRDRKGRFIPNKKTGQPFTLVNRPHTDVVNFQERVKEFVYEAQPKGELPWQMFEGPVFMSCYIYCTRPKSVKTMYPETQPDRTNFLKSSEDGLFDILFNDGQVVSGTVELRWAYYHYPDDPQTEQAPGLIFQFREMDTSLTKECNTRYRETLERLGLEYAPTWVGTGSHKRKQTLLVKPF